MTESVRDFTLRFAKKKGCEVLLEPHDVIAVYAGQEPFKVKIYRGGAIIGDKCYLTTKAKKVIRDTIAKRVKREKEIAAKSKSEREIESLGLNLGKYAKRFDERFLVLILRGRVITFEAIEGAVKVKLGDVSVELKDKTAYEVIKDLISQGAK